MPSDDDLIRRGDAVRVALGTCECQEAHEPHCETRGLGSPSVARALRALPAAEPSEVDKAARDLAGAVEVWGLFEFVDPDADWEHYNEYWDARYAAIEWVEDARARLREARGEG